MNSYKYPERYLITKRKHVLSERYPIHTYEFIQISRKLRLRVSIARRYLRYLTSLRSGFPALSSHLIISHRSALSHQIIPTSPHIHIIKLTTANPPACPFTITIINTNNKQHEARIRIHLPRCLNSRWNIKRPASTVWKAPSCLIR